MHSYGHISESQFVLLASEQSDPGTCRVVQNEIVDYGTNVNEKRLSVCHQKFRCHIKIGWNQSDTIHCSAYGHGIITQVVWQQSNKIVLMPIGSSSKTYFMTVLH